MLLSFTVATLVGVTVAQADAGCSNELLALYRAGGVATPEACQLLLNFEACVSQVADASERSTLEIDLNQQQQQHAACGTAAPLTASIRTSRDAMDFSGRDFTFHRTTRQSCNLFELRDLVTGFTQNISNTVSSIEAVQTSIGTMQAEIDAAAVEANVAAFRQTTVSSIEAVQTSIRTMRGDIDAGAAQNVSLRLAALELRIEQAFNAADTPCIPYVEYTNANGACVQLNHTCDAYNLAHYERVRPTRTSDRQCSPVSVACNATTQWEVAAPNTFHDRVCMGIPGLTQAAPVRGDCNVLRTVSAPRLAPSGFYWLEIASLVRQMYCDMAYDGGGWTMVGRGIGGARSCWATSADCNPQYSAAAHAWDTGPTWRTSDTRINQMTYSTIRFQGTGAVAGNQFWYGKNRAFTGGCTYRHRTAANGACNCASLNPDMTNRRCGSAHGGHQGVGDWPNNGGLHSMHTGNWWYFKKNAAHGTHMSSNGYCHGNNGGCNVALWVR